MVVFRHNALTGIAQLQTNSIIHRHGQCAAYPYIRIRLHAIDFGFLVWTDNNCTSGHCF